MRILNLYAGIGGNRKLWGDWFKIVIVGFTLFVFVLSFFVWRMVFK
jgi:hypothetical protein